MKTYFKSLVLLSIFIVAYGFVVPSLIAMKDSLNVITGFVVAAVIPVVLFTLFKSFFTKKERK